MIWMYMIDGMFDGSLDEPIFSYDRLVKFSFVVELEKKNWSLKRILLQRDVSIVGLQDM